MYTQHSELKGGRVVAVENGPTVKLTQQTQDHRALFVDTDGEEFALPASEFFQCYREATAAESEEAFPAKNGRTAAANK